MLLTRLKRQIFTSKNQFDKVMVHAEQLVKYQSNMNPRELLGNDLSLLTDNIRKLLGTGHPVLETISNYYFSKQGKHLRPLIVLLVSLATKSHNIRNIDVNNPLEPNTTIFLPSDQESNHVLSTQKRLAEITEMIHTASLLHDDVIDLSITRRNQPSANAEFGNKMAILAGDFLLARASVALARLRNINVVELLATVISNLVEGEFMQLRNSGSTAHCQSFPKEYKKQNIELDSRFDYYLEKTYLKTASLIAKSCQAATILGNCDSKISEIAYEYGRNLGLAFQLIDDVLDFVVTSDEFGKPVNADLSLGLATAPVLYASDQFPELIPLIERNFKKEGDARKLVLQSDGIVKTRNLAKAFCEQARKSLDILSDSNAKTALIDLTEAVLTRTK